MDMMNAKEIKEFRHSLNLTQEDFAHLLGVTSTSIGNWELGKRKPTRMAQKLLAEIKASIEKENEDDKKTQNTGA